MWVRKADYNWLRSRVDKLEAMLEVERAENRRVERHWGDMILRRGGSLPVPAAVSEAAPPPRPEPPVLTETQMAQAEAVVEYGRAQGFGRQQIEDAVRVSVPGITNEAIAAAISQGSVM